MEKLGLKMLLLASLLVLASASLAADLTDPTVFIVVLARNKAHTLPHFLGLLRELDYPRDRISLWIRSDHNEDATPAILRRWVDAYRGDYHSVDLAIDESRSRYEDEVNPWSGTSDLRFEHVMRLKDEGLRAARRSWADFAWFLDADAFVTHPGTLKDMTTKTDLTVFAPLMVSTGQYSNFWAGMGEDYYYVRTDSYKPILERKEVDCFEVPLVHSSVMVNLRHKARLSFHPDGLGEDGYQGPFDDMIAFAVSAAGASGVKPSVCNQEVYGYVMVPLSGDDKTLQDDLINLTNIKTEVIEFFRNITF